MGRKNSFRPKEVLFETKAQRCAETINERVLAKNFCQDAYGDHFSASRTSAVPLKLRRPHGLTPLRAQQPFCLNAASRNALHCRTSGSGAIGPEDNSRRLAPPAGSLRGCVPVPLHHRFEEYYKKRRRICQPRIFALFSGKPRAVRRCNLKKRMIAPYGDDSPFAKRSVKNFIDFFDSVCRKYMVLGTTIFFWVGDLPLIIALRVGSRSIMPSSTASKMAALSWW